MWLARSVKSSVAVSIACLSASDTYKVNNFITSVSVISPHIVAMALALQSWWKITKSLVAGQISVVFSGCVSCLSLNTNSIVSQINTDTYKVNNFITSVSVISPHTIAMALALQSWWKITKSLVAGQISVVFSGCVSCLSLNTNSIVSQINTDTYKVNNFITSVSVISPHIIAMALALQSWWKITKSLVAGQISVVFSGCVNCLSLSLRHIQSKPFHHKCVCHFSTYHSHGSCLAVLVENNPSHLWLARSV